jgi:hypothetical protein
MNQDDIIRILNKHVFDNERAAVVQAVASNPDRFVGVFRSTTPRLKLLQNILQSREVRFGDALEEVIRKLIADMGFVHLPNEIRSGEKQKLACDQYFCSSDQTQYFVVEQKVRDDHDSSKRDGQITNFRKKLEYLRAQHGTALTGILYFIDPALNKNRKFYEERLAQLRQMLGVRLMLQYGSEFFAYMQGHTCTWSLLFSTLESWRRGVPEDINLNLDSEPEKTLDRLQNVSVNTWKKLAAHDGLWESGVIQVIFPIGATLRMLVDRLNSARQAQKQRVAQMLRKRIEAFYRT